MGYGNIPQLFGHGRIVSSDRQPECALWVWRFHHLGYDLCDNEAEAVNFALAIEDDNTGSVAGVQFADGRIVAHKNWRALRDEQDRRMKEWEAEDEAARSLPARPTRKIRTPFGDQTIDVYADAPSWIGLPDEGCEQ